MFSFVVGIIALDECIPKTINRMLHTPRDPEPGSAQECLNKELCNQIDPMPDGISAWHHVSRNHHASKYAFDEHLIFYPRHQTIDDRVVTKASSHMSVPNNAQHRPFQHSYTYVHSFV